MNTLIAGASGFIGHELIKALEINNQITVIGRNKTNPLTHLSPSLTYISWEQLDNLNAKNYDAVINLCGYNIAASRWTNDIKKQLIDSRVITSTTLIQWIIKHQAKPHFLCANAVGIYGVQDNDDQTDFDEDTVINIQSPRDFLSEIGIRWQEALQPAIEYGIPVTTLRFGVVLKKGGGMLKKLTLSFNLGLGSIVGDGKQILSWVHMDDVVGAILFLLQKPELTGAFNITSPNPVSQAEFARTLGASMHRPVLLTMPACFIRMLFGEMGEYLLLKGQRVLPKRLSSVGYVFRYPQLNEALNHEMS